VGVCNKQMKPFSPYTHTFKTREVIKENVSLASVAAKEQERRKKESGESTRVILTYDSNQSNAVLQAAGVKCGQIKSAGPAPEQEAGGGGSNDAFRFSLLLSDRISSIFSHRLVSAQIRAWEFSSNVSIPSTINGSAAEDELLTLTITEQFTIVPANRNVYTITMPLTLTSIGSIEVVQDEDDQVLFILQTNIPHAYVLGLRFFLSLGSDYNICQDVCPRFALSEKGEWLEVVEILDPTCFIAVRVCHGNDILEACRFQPFSPEIRGIKAPKASCFGPCYRQKNGYVRGWGVPPPCPCTEVNVAFDSRTVYHTRNAFAYIPPPTSPADVAWFVKRVGGIEVTYDSDTDTYVMVQDGVQRRVRLLLRGTQGDVSLINFPLSRKVMTAVEKNTEQKEQYIQKVLGSFQYFHVIENVNNSFCLRLDTEQACLAPIRIEPGIYSGSQLAAMIAAALNAHSSKCVTTEVLSQFSVRFELFTTESLRRLRGLWLGAPPTVANDPKYMEAFAVEAASLPCYNDPYMAQTFVFVIENTQGSLFSLLLENCQGFADLIDFSAKNYELRSEYAGRALSTLCDGAGTKAAAFLRTARRHCAISCAPFPRRYYSAKMDGSLITLQQSVGTPQCFSIIDPCCSKVCQLSREDLILLEDARPPGTIYSSTNSHLFRVGDAVLVSQRPVEASDVDISLAIVLSTPSPRLLSLNRNLGPSVFITPVPVGFNLHLSPQMPPRFTSSRISQNNALQQWLGFLTPSTRTGCQSYTSDRCPASIIDQQILMVIPELCSLNDGRPSVFTQTSPFESQLVEVYGKLQLDAGGYYRFGVPGVLSNLYTCVSENSSITCPPYITVQLLRSDGTAYRTGGNSLVFDLEMIYC
jgi:hypothetical protein